MLKRICTLALALLAAAPAFAGDAIKLKNGERLVGDAVAYDDTSQVLTFRTDDGVDHALALDDLDGRSVYHVTRSKVPQDNGKGQLQLANYARDIELYAHAVRHYKYAAKADPGLKEEVEREMAILRSAAAKWAMGRAEEAIKDKNSREAEKWLTAIIEKLPDEPEAAKAQAILDGHHRAVRDAREADLKEKQTIALETDLKPAKRYYDSMLDKTRAGLTGKSSAAVRNFESAISDGQRASRELDKVIKKHASSEHLDTLLGYRELVDQALVELHLHLASHYTTRTSYNNAQKEVNKALAIDPRNRDALAARARIESAVNDGWGIFR